MGTRFELVLVADDPERLRPTAEAALHLIETWHHRLTRFEPDSLVSFINRTAAARPVRLDRETYELFACCQHVWEASNGAFDITVGPLMERLGFHDLGQSAGDVVTGMKQLELDPEKATIRFRTKGVSLDFGAIGKGHALDQAADALRSGGVESALLHGGTSSVVAIGHPPGLKGWRVGLGPDPTSQKVCLRDAALAVSRPTGRTITTSAGAIGHILDPRSGNPIQLSEAVVVLGPSARLCDAWSTALVVLGQQPAGFPPDLTVLSV